MAKKQVKFSFALMILNYERIQEYVDKVPEMTLYENKKFEWDDMIKMELHVPSHYLHLFKNSDLKMLFGHKKATWQQIFKKLLGLYKKDEKNFQKEFDESYKYYNADEHVALKEIIRNLNKIKNEKDFKKIVTKPEDYRTFDINRLYDVTDLLFNYCVNHKLYFEYFSDEWVEELKALNLKRINSLRTLTLKENDILKTVVNMLVPFAKNAHKKDKHCGLSNFYSAIQSEVDRKIKRYK